MKRKIVIRTQFPAIHNWQDCPYSDVSFLRMPHRHVFHVTMKFEVNHNERDIEFIRQKNEVERYIRRTYYDLNLGSKSCETIAEELLQQFGAVYVSVFEDNENGAEVEL